MTPSVAPTAVRLREGSGGLAGEGEADAGSGSPAEESDDGTAPSEPWEEVDQEPATSSARPAEVRATDPRTPAPAGARITTPSGFGGYTGPAASLRPAMPAVRSSPSVMVSASTFPSTREPTAPVFQGPDRSLAQPAYKKAAPGGAVRAATAKPLDAPIARDEFREGGFEDFASARAPIDDLPAQVMEDVGQPYTKVYTVGDPPPLPGMADRFTPPPPLRTELGSRRVRGEVSERANPDRKERFQPTPPPSRRASTPRLAAASPTPMVLVEEKQGPQWFWLGVGGIGLGAIGGLALIGAVMLVYGGAGKGDEEEPAFARRPTANREVEPADVAPAPAPAPAPASPVAPAANAVSATVKVHANRRALVYVDQKFSGYTPVSVTVPVGKHVVEAMMPGQPNSRLSKEAVVQNLGEVVPVDFSF